MEYTKDMIFQVHYEDIHRKCKAEGRSWTSRIRQAIKRHKIMTAMVSSAVIFISIDAVLITNFFHILTTL